MVTLVCLSSLKAQDLGVHQQSKTYEWPANPEVREKLDQWQDQKFGMIIHWGLYAVPGIIESWGLCSEDWINRPDSMTYNGYKSWYWGLKDEFNPVNFDPEKWAEVADEAGMKYLVLPPSIMMASACSTRNKRTSKLQLDLLPIILKPMWRSMFLRLFAIKGL